MRPLEPGTGNARPIDPSFRCIRGLMHGYSQHNNGPSRKNIQALIRDLSGSLDYVAANPEASWEDVLQTVEEFPRSFVRMFCDGDWPRP